jgi:hypothetical protein
LWENFSGILSSLFPQQKNLNFAVKWKDEDGDVIVMETQREWEEAIACCPSWPLRLYVNFEQAKEEPKEEKEPKEEVKETIPFTVTAEYFYSESGEEKPTFDEQYHLTKTIPQIIDRLLTPHGALPGWLMTAITATSSRGDVLLDVDVPRFSNTLHRRALEIMNQADACSVNASTLDAEAVTLLRDCVLLTPGDDIANFNLGCALSRTGEIAESMFYLDKYLAFEGAKLNYIHDDSDLENVRNSAAFSEWFKKYAPKEEVKEEPVVESVSEVDDVAENLEKFSMINVEPSAPALADLEPEVEAEPQLEPEVEVEKWAEELKTLAELGFDEQASRILLEDYNGNLELVVAAQFQSQFL